MLKTLQPEGWAKPAGYANGVSARGRVIHVAGQIGWNTDSRFETDDFVGQVRQSLQNVVAVLACDDARPELPGPGVSALSRGQQPQEVRLAGAVGADDAEELPVGHLEGDVVHGVHGPLAAAVAAVKSAGDDHRAVVEGCAGGSGGVGIRKSLPCLEGEQLGFVAGLQVIHEPVNVLLSG